MRIIQVIDYFHTDVGYQEYFLAREQAAAGHQVTVITSEHRQHGVADVGPDEQLGLDELLASGARLVRLPARQLGHDRAWIHGLEGAIRDARPEGAHVHGPFSPTTVRAVRAARRAGASVLVDNHVQVAIAPGATDRRNRLIYAGYGATAAPYLRRAVDSWVANGPYEAEFLAERMHLADHDVELLPLGFDETDFAWNPERRQRARAELGAAPSEVVVAVSGKIHPGKRPEAAAAACERLAAGPGAPAVRLLLAGSVPAECRAAVTAAAPTLTEQGRVVELGVLGRIALGDLFHAADAVVFPRLPSISIYEAAGTGARVLVGDDRFSRWLAGLCPSVEPVAINPLDLGGLRAEEEPGPRTERAAAARAAFGWSRVAADFVDRYAAPRLSGSRT